MGIGSSNFIDRTAFLWNLLFLTYLSRFSNLKFDPCQLNGFTNCGGMTSFKETWSGFNIYFLNVYKTNSSDSA